MFIPNLDPENNPLILHDLGQLCFAACATQSPANNAGVVVGLESTLVIDSLISPLRARELIDMIHNKTSTPIRYLINTNFHGDHTFGNSEFPPDCEIIAHTSTKAAMLDFYRESNLIAKTMRSTSPHRSNTRWRRPTQVFDSQLSVDLGSQQVDLFHCGGGNTEGDICVFARNAGVLYTGNFIIGGGLLPSLGDQTISNYLAAVENLLARNLDIRCVISGHGAITDDQQIGFHQRYLQFLVASPAMLLDCDADLHEYVELSLKRFLTADVAALLQAQWELCVQIHKTNLLKSSKVTVQPTLMENLP